MIEDFLRENDAAWRWPSEDKIDLGIIGSTALMLQTRYQRGTNDSDVLQTVALDETLCTRLKQIAGKDTPLHKRRRLYLDIVGNGIPFLPQSPRFHPLTSLNATLQHFTRAALDVTDVVVSKLKPFRSNDISDINAMIEMEFVTHTALRQRFQDAFDCWMDGARNGELLRYVRNLNKIERDAFLVPESTFEYPSWFGH